MVNETVTEARDEHGDQRDDEDAGPNRQRAEIRVVRDSVECLASDDLIDSSPSDAGDAVENDGSVDADDTERIATNDHLPQSTLHAEGREQGDGDRAQQVEEQDDEGGVGQTKTVDAGGECAERECRNCGICRAPEETRVHETCVMTSILVYALDTCSVASSRSVASSEASQAATRRVGDHFTGLNDIIQPKSLILRGEVQRLTLCFDAERIKPENDRPELYDGKR